MSNKSINKSIDFSDTKIAFEQYDNVRLKKTYVIFALMNQNWLVKIGTFFINLFLKIGFPIKKAIKVTIFQHFCGGESITDCQQSINNLNKYNVGTILDYSVEGEDSEEDFEKTKNEILKTIKYAKQNLEKVPFSVFKISGIGSTEILEKANLEISNLTVAELEKYKKIENRILEICTEAFINQVKIFFDAEETWIQGAIDRFCLAMMLKFNVNDLPIVYNTYQMYRNEGFEILKKHIAVTKKNNVQFGAKLVRGAYIEKERKRAQELNYKDPINETKDKTDIEFDKALTYCIDHIDTVAICLGTHNEQSCKLGLELLRKKGLDSDTQRVYFAQLLGMSDNISFNLAKEGFRVAKYVPYGPIEAIMPYLFRRAAENTSIAGQTGREFALIKKEINRRKINNNEVIV
jgi:proline dehydrogenase